MEVNLFLDYLLLSLLNWIRNIYIIFNLHPIPNLSKWKHLRVSTSYNSSLSSFEFSFENLACLKYYFPTTLQLNIRHLADLFFLKNHLLKHFLIQYFRWYLLMVNFLRILVIICTISVVFESEIITWMRFSLTVNFCAAQSFIIKKYFSNFCSTELKIRCHSSAYGLHDM